MTYIDGNLVPLTSGQSQIGYDPISGPTNAEEIPFQQIWQLSGVFMSPIHGRGGGLRFNPANSGMEVTNDLSLTGQGFHPFGQSVTRTICRVRGFHDMLHVDPGTGTITRTDPLVVSVTDITTIAGQLMTKGFLARIPFQFTLPDWVDTNYPIRAKATLLVGNTAPSGAGQQIEIETNIGWNGDNNNIFPATGSKASASTQDISTYAALDYIDCDLGDVLDARSCSNRDLIHGVLKRDATPSNFLDDDYPDAIALLDLEFIGRVKRGFAGEFE
jgi:hypothetical protein